MSDAYVASERSLGAASTFTLKKEETVLEDEMALLCASLCSLELHHSSCPHGQY